MNWTYARFAELPIHLPKTWEGRTRAHGEVDIDPQILHDKQEAEGKATRFLFSPKSLRFRHGTLHDNEP